MENKTVKKHHIRSTQNQIRLLMNYMATHKNFANSVSKKASPLEAYRKTKEWSTLRCLLRKHGPDKSVEKWKQTWRDIKRKIRNQRLEANRSVETFYKDHEHLENDTTNELHKINEHESSTEELDLPKSSDGHASKETQSKKFIRSTEAQNKILINYMLTHKTFAYLASKVILNPLDASRKAKEWSALRSLLRKHGPDRTIRQWKTTWSNLKRRTLKKSNSETKLENDSTSNELDTILENESFSEYADPIERTDGASVSIKAEPSTYHDENPTVQVRCSSPMQLVLTNSSFSSKTKTACTQTSFCNPNICSNICPIYSNPPSSWSRDNQSAASQCCNLNVPMSTNAGSTVDDSQIQENTLLQSICNLLEERNSNLKMINLRERRKIRFQYRRKY